ncbi:OLC1v1016011C1 [Oldenlandia corymbosa var. corymbosa]|uniref:OLC1v1016011C1 n=1 Tax=Oldenlandia corymbosa var. corymbosa TaxID=529605 RepID=A0AAV1E773_OLDCO|nr:OLC1v1016011C1 [Oldenlandia corymbosa var. corymbosa]
MGSSNIDAILLIIGCMFLVIFNRFECVCSHDLNVADNSKSAGCIDSERLALMELKGSLVDPPNRLSSWTGKDCCNWKGIACDNHTGHVVTLDLGNHINPYSPVPFSDTFFDFMDNMLWGKISTPSICDLEDLNYLDLSSNNFAGTQIPKCFGSLRNLRYLNLSLAGFEGEIPPHLGNLSRLQHLDIARVSSFGFATSYTLSTKNLEWVTGLSFLKSLDLSGIVISESHRLLDSVNMLPSLSSLQLRKCFSPDGIGNHNSPLVPSHFNLTPLVSLDIGGNGLESPSLLNWFSNLSSNLQVLRIGGNNFDGPFPFTLRKFPHLTVLDISSNLLFNYSPLLDSLCNHTSLSSVDLSYNQLQGSLPLCLGNVTSLNILRLGSNNFGGEIPSELCNLKQLTDLELDSNSFNSSIPPCIGRLTELESLYLNENQLSGTIPSTLGQLSRLKVLAIGQNSLTGALSESHFTELKNLDVLSVSGNKFLTLNVSNQWIPPFQLRSIYMGSVHMGNQFPSWLQTQKNVVELDMANAGISDRIPDWFGSTFSSVQYLNLSGNDIHGEVPLSMKRLRYLDILDLSGNQLSGTLSEWIGEELSQLEDINLQSNNFSGNIPTQLCQLPNLQKLRLANNSLTGHLPADCFS